MRPNAAPKVLVTLFCSIPRNSSSSASPVDIKSMKKAPISKAGVNCSIRGAGLSMKNSIIPDKNPVAAMRTCSFALPFKVNPTSFRDNPWLRMRTIDAANKGMATMGNQ